MPQLERTEDQIVSIAPIKVTLGRAEYEIAPLPILQARKWRVDFAQEAKAIGDRMQKPAESGGSFFAGLSAAFLVFPEKLAEMVFAFAPNLPKEQIEAQATDEQIAAAFDAVMVLAFPFRRQLQMVTSTLAMASSTANLPR